MGFRDYFVTDNKKHGAGCSQVLIMAWQQPVLPACSAIRFQLQGWCRLQCRRHQNQRLQLILQESCEW
jgi:hypothetical protein